MPWGTDGNGTYFYWLADGDPDRWTVTVIGFDGEPIVSTELSFEAFLVELLSGRLPDLAFVPVRSDPHVYQWRS